MTVLGDADILEKYKNGQIVITPFNKSLLNNASYDVRLGYHLALPIMHPGIDVDPTKVDAKDFYKIVDIRDMGGCYWLPPGIRILAHTHEFIGGRLDPSRVSDKIKATGLKISPRTGYLGSMKTKSTPARWGLDWCMSAGWGDCDFTGRWALEIINVSPWRMPLYPGMIGGQVVFEEVQGVETSYIQIGHYQSTYDMDKLIKEWKPEDLLPKRIKIMELEEIPIGG